MGRLGNSLIYLGAALIIITIIALPGLYNTSNNAITTAFYLWTPIYEELFSFSQRLLLTYLEIFIYQYALHSTEETIRNLLTIAGLLIITGATISIVQRITKKPHE